MKVTVFLRNDHDTLKSLFERFKNPSGSRTPNGKKDLFNDIQREVLLHYQMGVEIFYPALAGTSSERSAEIMASAEREYRTVEKSIEELSSMNASDKEFESKMNQLMEEVQRHIDLAEEEIFDEARKNLPELRLEELGLEMADRRKILSTLAA